jgi:hypothetical protein
VVRERSLRSARLSHPKHAPSRSARPNEAEPKYPLSRPGKSRVGSLVPALVPQSACCGTSGARERRYARAGARVKHPPGAEPFDVTLLEASISVTTDRRSRRPRGSRMDTRARWRGHRRSRRPDGGPGRRCLARGDTSAAARAHHRWARTRPVEVSKRSTRPGGRGMACQRAGWTRRRRRRPGRRETAHATAHEAL